MSLEDGLTPLLGDEATQAIKLPDKKLNYLRALLGCSVIVDICASIFCCTAGLSVVWWQHLGIGIGAYPFGSAGLDLLLLGLLRPFLAGLGCVAFATGLRRANLQRVALENCDGEAHSSVTDTTAAINHTIPSDSSNIGISQSEWRNRRGKSGTALRGDGDEVVDVARSESQVNTPVSRKFWIMLKISTSVVLSALFNSSNPYDGTCSLAFPRWTQWLEPLCPSGSLATLLVVVAKCLTRLIVGPGYVQDRDSGLSTPWFWAAVGWSALAAGTEFIIVSGFTATCRRYWFLYCCRERGDLESALRGERGERQGGEGNGGKETSAYSATFGDILSLCKEDWRMILCAFVALLIAACCEVLIPHFTGDIIDNVIESGDSREFRRSTVYLVLASIVCATFTAVRGAIFTMVGGSVNVRIRRKLFESLVSQEIGFFDNTKTGDLSSRLSNDCTKVGDQVTLNVNVFLRNLVMVLATLLFMFYLSWRLSLVAFVSVPTIVVVSRYYGVYIRELSKLSQDKLAEAGTVAEESLSSMPTVRSFAAEGRETKAYATTLDEYYVLSRKAGTAYFFYSFTNNLLPNLVTALVLFYGGRLVMQGQITSGKVVSFMIYLSTLSGGFDDMAYIFNSMTQAVGAADKVFELIRRKPRWNDARSSAPGNGEDGGSVNGNGNGHGGAAAPATCRGAIELRDVNFEYPSRPSRRILNGVSFNAAPGQVLALVGPSGGGKSSCIALLENLYQPSGGKVMLDGLSVSEYDHSWLHRSMSIVGQEPTLFARSIRENITYGLEDEEPSMYEVEQAARLANAHLFISQLPDKYETHAGERGVQMSGGQKQRIAIARALVRKPRVLLLDEATSALDAESEHLVQQAIDNMISRGGMTVILIAHRLSTVKRADKIVVVQAGKVVEEGSHEDLLSNKGGVYSGLVKRQLDLGEDADKEDIGRSTPGPSAIARSRKSLSKAGSKRRSTRMSSCDASSSSEVEG